MPDKRKITENELNKVCGGQYIGADKYGIESKNIETIGKICPICGKVSTFILSEYNSMLDGMSMVCPGTGEYEGKPHFVKKEDWK